MGVPKEVLFQPDGRPVAVTGAGGSMGKHYVERLAKTVPVRAFARRVDDLERLGQIPNVQPIKADVTDADSLRRGLEGVGTVFHLAVNDSITDWRANFRINVGGTENLARAAEDNGVNHIQVISSIAVYGKQENDKPIKEDAPHNSQNAYGVTKSGQERIIFDSTNRFESSAIRPANVIGPDIDVWTHAILSVLDGLERDSEFGSKEIGRIASRLNRQWARRIATLSPILTSRAVFATIEIENAVDLSIRAAQNPNGVGQAFNAVDQNITLSKISTEYLRNVLNRPAVNPPTIVAAPLNFVADNTVGIVNLLLKSNLLNGARVLLYHGQRYSTEKADTLLGHEHRVSLDESVARTRDYVQEYGLLHSRKLYK